VAGPAQAARELRARVGAAPGETLELPRDEVVHALAPPSVNGDDPAETARFAQALLRLHGVRVRPPLSDSGAVRATLRLDRGLAVQGAVAVAVLALLAGATGRPLYAFVLGLAGAIGVFIVARAWPWLDEHAPRAIPRGRTLGALTALVLVAVAGLAVVFPVHESGKDSSGNPAYALSLLQGARESLAAGDLKTAQNRVTQATYADPGNPAIDDVRQQVTIARFKELLDEQARKEGVFDEAERAYAHGDTAKAIKLMSSIKGFRNADERLAVYRRATASR
jgi:hypothetical protein